MKRKIKLIWDFYGEDAFETAKHHSIHLKEYVQKTGIIAGEINALNKQDFAEAFMVVEEQDLLKIRDQLKPKRGQWIEESTES